MFPVPAIPRFGSPLRSKWYGTPNSAIAAFQSHGHKLPPATYYLQHLGAVYFLQNTSVPLMHYLHAVHILPIYICIYMFFFLIYLFIYLFTYLFIYLFIYTSMYFFSTYIRPRAYPYATHMYSNPTLYVFLNLYIMYVYYHCYYYCDSYYHHSYYCYYYYYYHCYYCYILLLLLHITHYMPVCNL